MTQSGSDDAERLRRFLSRLDRRERLAPVVRGASIGAGLGLAGLVAKGLAQGLGLLPPASGWLLVALSILLPLAGAAAGYRRPDLRHAAATGDRRAGLADLLKTAHGFEPGRRDQEAWRPLLDHRAAEQADRLEPASIVPIPWRPITALAVLILACALVPRTPARLLPSAASLSPLTSGGAEEEGLGAARPEAPADQPTETEPEPEAPARLQLSAEQIAQLREAQREAGDELGQGEAAIGSELGEELEAASGEAGSEIPEGANEELLQEVRRQLEEEGTLPSAAEAGAPGESTEAGEAGEGAQAGSPTAPSDPNLEHQTDELTTIEAPTSAPSSEMSRRSAGSAEVAVPAGVDIEAGDQPQQGAEAGDPGAAEGGSSTAPQEGFVNPLGELPTELDVTLELALLESQQQEAARETSREMTPSRAGESTARSAGREPVAPTAEAVPSRQPVPWRHRRLVRQYFDPTPPATQETPPS